MPGSISFWPRAHCVDELTNGVYGNLGLLDRYRVSARFGDHELALRRALGEPPLAVVPQPVELRESFLVGDADVAPRVGRPSVPGTPRPDVRSGSW